MSTLSVINTVGILIDAFYESTMNDTLLWKNRSIRFIYICRKITTFIFSEILTTKFTDINWYVVITAAAAAAMLDVEKRIVLIAMLHIKRVYRSINSI